MLGSSVCYSTVHLTMALTAGAEAPFLWNAVFRLGGAAGGVLALLLIRPTTPIRPVLKALARVSLRPEAALLLFPYLGFTLFALASSFAGYAIGVITFQVWPALLVLFMARWGNTTAANIRTTPTGWALTLLCTLGAILAAASTGNTIGGTLGLITGIAAAISAAATAWNFRWATRTVSALQTPGDQSLWTALMLLFIWGSALSALTAAALHWTLGSPALGQSLNTAVILPILATGLTMDASGTVLSRWANLQAATLMVNVCAYSSPVMSIALLFLTGHAGVDRPGLFVTGAALVIGSAFALRMAEVRPTAKK